VTLAVRRIDLPTRVADALGRLRVAADDAAGHLDDPDLDVVRAALDRVLWATVALDVATT
jgi:hypothetical protein